MGSGTIQELWLSCKRFGDDALHDWGVIALVIFVGLASFGLGRLSGLEASKGSISVSQAASAAIPGSMQPLQLGGSYVGSRGGSTYYFPWCGGASSIDPNDQVWFKSEAAAQKAGYSPAKNCKGLAQ